MTLRCRATRTTTVHTSPSQPYRRRTTSVVRRPFVFLGVVLSVAALLLPACGQQEGNAVAAGGAGNTAAPKAGGPPAVTVVIVQPETLPISSEWISTLDGFVNAQIRPQVTGYLIRRSYEEGAVVEKDQVLFEIDPRPFRTALAQAEATLARAQADLGRAERDRARDTPLARERAIPQSQLDNDIQAELAAKAAVKAAQAAIDAAKLNLGFTKVRSLIDGVAAIATAQIGDLVNPSTLLTTVSQVDPIRAYFSISEQEYLKSARQLNQAAQHEPRQVSRAPSLGSGHPNPLSSASENANPLSSASGHPSPLELFLADGSRYDKPGRFLAADRQIDPRTGTIRISATFPNPDRVLRPGMYGRVRAETSVVADALLVPQRAVNEMQGAAQVRIVGPDNKVILRNVTLGARAGARWVVQTGLAPGDQVVLDAPQLRDGTIVAPTPLAASAHNTPADTAAARRE
jgi:RND family efflux transporter MFP subunit